MPQGRLPPPHGARDRASGIGMWRNPFETDAVRGTNGAESCWRSCNRNGIRTLGTATCQRAKAGFIGSEARAFRADLRGSAFRVGRG